MSGFTIFRLLLLSILIKLVSFLGQLPASSIDSFIRLFAIRKIIKLGLARSFYLFVNPISIIRYFEFDFVIRNLPLLNQVNILDIASPRVLGFYLCFQYPKLNYTMINLDEVDIAETQTQADALGLKNFNLKNANALHLPFKDDTFHVIISVSVVEHISGNGDSQAIKEMLRVLRPRGKLIITTHAAKKYRQEFRNIDHYNLQAKKQKQKYFFQRMYNMENLKKRLYDPLKLKPVESELIGEKERGWFDKYIFRLQKEGLKKAVFDPWYMMTKFEKYDSIESLPGIGVIGLVFEKK